MFRVLNESCLAIAVENIPDGCAIARQTVTRVASLTTLRGRSGGIRNSAKGERI
jgi:hypothetical protein